MVQVPQALSHTELIGERDLIEDLKWLIELGLLDSAPEIEGIPGVGVNGEGLRAMSALVGAWCLASKRSEKGPRVADMGSLFLAAVMEFIEHEGMTDAV